MTISTLNHQSIYNYSPLYVLNPSIQFEFIINQMILAREDPPSEEYSQGEDMNHQSQTSRWLKHPWTYPKSAWGYFQTEMGKCNEDQKNYLQHTIYNADSEELTNKITEINHKFKERIVNIFEDNHFDYLVIFKMMGEYKTKPTWKSQELFCMLNLAVLEWVHLISSNQSNRAIYQEYANDPIVKRNVVLRVMILAFSLLEILKDHKDSKPDREENQRDKKKKYKGNQFNYFGLMCQPLALAMSKSLFCINFRDIFPSGVDLILIETYADFINVCITQNFTASANVRDYVGEMIDAMVYLWPNDSRFIINNMIEHISESERVGHSYYLFFDFSHFRYKAKVFQSLILTTLKVVTFYGTNFGQLSNEEDNIKNQEPDAQQSKDPNVQILGSKAKNQEPIDSQSQNMPQQGGEPESQQISGSLQSKSTSKALKSITKPKKKPRKKEIFTQKKQKGIQNKIFQYIKSRKELEVLLRNICAFIKHIMTKKPESIYEYIRELICLSQSPFYYFRRMHIELIQLVYLRAHKENKSQQSIFRVQIIEQSILKGFNDENHNVRSRTLEIVLQMINKDLFPSYFLLQISNELIKTTEDPNKLVRKRAFNSIQDYFQKIFKIYGINSLEPEEDYHDEIAHLQLQNQSLREKCEELMNGQEQGSDIDQNKQELMAQIDKNDERIQKLVNFLKIHKMFNDSMDILNRLLRTNQDQDQVLECAYLLVYYHKKGIKSVRATTQFLFQKIVCEADCNRKLFRNTLKIIYNIFFQIQIGHQRRAARKFVRLYQNAQDQASMSILDRFLDIFMSRVWRPSKISQTKFQKVMAHHRARDKNIRPQTCRFRIQRQKKDQFRLDFHRIWNQFYTLIQHQRSPQQSQRLLRIIRFMSHALLSSHRLNLLISAGHIFQLKQLINNHIKIVWFKELINFVYLAFRVHMNFNNCQMNKQDFLDLSLKLFEDVVCHLQFTEFAEIFPNAYATMMHDTAFYLSGCHRSIWESYKRPNIPRMVVYRLKNSVVSGLMIVVGMKLEKEKFDALSKKMEMDWRVKLQFVFGVFVEKNVIRENHSDNFLEVVWEIMLISSQDMERHMSRNQEIEQMDMEEYQSLTTNERIQRVTKTYKRLVLFLNQYNLSQRGMFIDPPKSRFFKKKEYKNWMDRSNKHQRKKYMCSVRFSHHLSESTFYPRYHTDFQYSLLSGVESRNLTALCKKRNISVPDQITFKNSMSILSSYQLTGLGQSEYQRKYQGGIEGEVNKKFKEQQEDIRIFDEELQKVLTALLKFGCFNMKVLGIQGLFCMTFNDNVKYQHQNMIRFFFVSLFIDKDQRIRDIILPFIYYIQKTYPNEFLNDIYLLYALSDQQDHAEAREILKPFIQNCKGGSEDLIRTYTIIFNLKRVGDRLAGFTVQNQSYSRIAEIVWPKLIQSQEFDQNQLILRLFSEILNYHQYDLVIKNIILTVSLFNLDVVSFDFMNWEHKNVGVKVSGPEFIPLFQKMITRFCNQQGRAAGMPDSVALFQALYIHHRSQQEFLKQKIIQSEKLKLNPEQKKNSLLQQVTNPYQLATLTNLQTILQKHNQQRQHSYIDNTSVRSSSQKQKNKSKSKSKKRQMRLLKQRKEAEQYKVLDKKRKQSDSQESFEDEEDSDSGKKTKWKHQKMNNRE